MCFGQFAFEFARRARQENEEHPFRRWNVERLAEQNIYGAAGSGNVVPLLHDVIAQQFLYRHRKFSGGKGNYREHIAQFQNGCFVPPLNPLPRAESRTDLK
jgi:hypothetical protein